MGAISDLWTSITTSLWTVWGEALNQDKLNAFHICSQPSWVVCFEPSNYLKPRGLFFVAQEMMMLWDTWLWNLIANSRLWIVRGCGMTYHPYIHKYLTLQGDWIRQVSSVLTDKKQRRALNHFSGWKIQKFWMCSLFFLASVSDNWSDWFAHDKH